MFMQQLKVISKDKHKSDPKVTSFPKTYLLLRVSNNHSLFPCLFHGNTTISKGIFRTY